jgi:hypothetical protein
MPKVYPIAGLIGVGFPNTEHDVEDDDDLAAHLASGAFALSPEEAEKRSPLYSPPPPKSKSKE